jgi:hypothetical protein
MARMLDGFRPLWLLALLWCSGCASGRAAYPAADRARFPITFDGTSLVQGWLQDMAQASLHNWNFNRDRW